MVHSDIFPKDVVSNDVKLSVVKEDVKPDEVKNDIKPVVVEINIGQHFRNE